MRGFRFVAAPVAAIRSCARPSRPFRKRLPCLEQSHSNNEHSPSTDSLTPLSSFGNSTSMLLRKKKRAVFEHALIDNLYRLSRSRQAEQFIPKGVLLLTAWGAPLFPAPRRILICSGEPAMS